MRHQPEVGKEFPLDAEVLNARTRRTRELTRSGIALMFAGLSAAALVVAGGVSLAMGNFESLNSVWAIVAAPLGLIVGYYFRGGVNGRSDNEGAT